MRVIAEYKSPSCTIQLIERVDVGLIYLGQSGYYEETRALGEWESKDVVAALTAFDDRVYWLIEQKRTAARCRPVEA